MIDQMLSYLMTVNNPNPEFKGMPLFDVEYLENNTRYRHIYNGILITTYARPTQRCNFE